MIIVRSPLRISLGGGGTDLRSYYRQHGGFVIAGAIDKYVYITLNATFEAELIVKYSKMERVQAVDEVQHPIVREALREVGVQDPSLEITSMADIPAGTGLGSSGSFTTGLLKALHTYYRNGHVLPRALAEQACRIEIDTLREPVGKQDQYIAAHGGLTCFRFLSDEGVEIWPLKVSTETLYNLEDNLLLFFTGYNRAASVVLKDQDERSRANDASMLDDLHFVKDIAFQSQEALEGGDLPRFAHLMDLHWQRKRTRSPGMTNADIDRWYALARENGALGGKLVGAGGGGFLMFYAEQGRRLRHAMLAAGLREIRFRFDFEGTKVFVQ